MSEGFFKIVANTYYDYMSACTIDAGGSHGVAVESFYDGTDNTKTWAWGNNGNLQIGQPSSISKRVLPGCVTNSGVKDFFLVSAGDSHNLAIDGTTFLGWAWGSGANGVLGDNSTTSKSTPVAICGGYSWQKLSAGLDHSLGYDIFTNGYAWGTNTFGQLGDNSTTSRLTPVNVKNNLGVDQNFYDISAGYYHSLGDYDDGLGGKVIGSWGYNGFGQLGDNSVTNRCYVVAVCGTHTNQQLSAGQYHSAMIDDLGAGWCWGWNLYGQLGDNSTTSRRTPVAVCGGHTFCYISAGYGHTLAIDTSGNTWGWGINNRGQLGDGSTTSRLTPVAVCGGHSFVQISAGNGFSMGMTASGAIWAWGFNNSGELGINDGGVTFVNTPVQVCGF